MRLRTARDVTRELRRVYTAARSGEIDPSDATKLAFVLGQIRDALAVEAENAPQAMLTSEERAVQVAKALCLHFAQKGRPRELAAPDHTQEPASEV